MKRPALLLLVLLWLALFIPRGALAEPSCALIVLVSGDETLAEQLRAQLVLRGLTVTATDECPALLVRIERRASGLWIGLTDTSGRPGERLISELATAAALIEAWARADLSAPLLLMRAATTPPTTTPTSTSLPTTSPSLFLVEEAPTSQPIKQPTIHQRRLQIGAEAEAIYAEESVGGGAKLSAGFSMKSFVLGGYLRHYSVFRKQCDADCINETPDGEILIDTKKSGGDILLSLAAPLYQKKVSLSLHAGAGLGWIALSSAVPSVVLKAPSRTGPRLDTQLVLSAPLTKDLRFIASLGFGVAPLADKESPTFLSRFILDAEPTTYVRGSIGLRFGGQ